MLGLGREQRQIKMPKNYPAVKLPFSWFNISLAIVNLSLFSTLLKKLFYFFLEFYLMLCRESYLLCHFCWRLLSVSKHLSFFKKFLSLFILREKKRTSGKGQREIEGERESQAGSTLSAWSPMWGPNSGTMRSWPEPKLRIGRLNPLSHPGAPTPKLRFLSHREVVGTVVLCCMQTMMFGVAKGPVLEENVLKSFSAQWDSAFWKF